MWIEEICECPSKKKIIIKRKERKKKILVPKKIFCTDFSNKNKFVSERSKRSVWERANKNKLCIAIQK